VCLQHGQVRVVFVVEGREAVRLYRQPCSSLLLQALPSPCPPPSLYVSHSMHAFCLPYVLFEPENGELGHARRRLQSQRGMEREQLWEVSFSQPMYRGYTVACCSAMPSPLPAQQHAYQSLLPFMHLVRSCIWEVFQNGMIGRKEGRGKRE